jgi:predicted enzyme related to lactoylglutathione lyase
MWGCVGDRRPTRRSRGVALVPADTDEKRARVGSQVGDHVAFVLGSDDCHADYDRLRERGVAFHGEPETVPWGVHAVFEDCYGTVFDLEEASE